MALGDRISFNSSLGTIRYIGEVEGAKGLWLGIEWDEPRGKHDGSVNGIRYFHCRLPNSGSFLRKNAPSIRHGRPFTEAVQEKYIDSKRNHGGLEAITLGSSDGVIQVEAVNMDKVRSKFSQLETLKEVGLELYDISTAGNPHAIEATTPNIRRLDLSKNLLSSWHEVARIVEQLRFLESLSLNYNRFELLSGQFPPFSSTITEISLNHTLMTWEQVCFLLPALPSLTRVGLGYCELNSLGDGTVPIDSSMLSRLDSLYLDGNQFTDWVHLMDSFKYIPRLTQVNLQENSIETIPLLSSANNPLPTIKALDLNTNSINRWESIDALGRWLPHLENLRIESVPLFIDSRYSRPIAIARLSSLKHLDGTQIAPQERQDAELLYLNLIVKETPLEERPQKHLRWKELVEKYGAPVEIDRQDNVNRLQSRLIDVDVFALSALPTESLTDPTDEKPTFSTQFLPKMPIKAVRLKILKLLGAKPKSAIRIYIWLKPDNSESGFWREITVEGSRGSDLEWWGIEDHGKLAVLVD